MKRIYRNMLMGFFAGMISYELGSLWVGVLLGLLGLSIIYNRWQVLRRRGATRDRRREIADVMRRMADDIGKERR